MVTPIAWNEWTLFFYIYEHAGLVLRDVMYKGIMFIHKASLPVIRVKYQDDECGPYADIADFSAKFAEFTDCDHKKVCIDSFTWDDTEWLQLICGIHIGEYRIKQAWQLSRDGRIAARLWTRGVSCSTDHIHHPYWRFDFDVDGAEHNDVWIQDGNSWKQFTVEGDVKKKPGRRFLIRNNRSGHAIWLTPGEHDGTADDFSTADFAVRRYHKYEDGFTIVPDLIPYPVMPWPFGAEGNLGYDNNESVVDTDVVVWYTAHLFHEAHGEEEGSLGEWIEGGPTLEIALAAVGSSVSGLARDPNKLDVFMVGTDGRILTAAWDHFAPKGHEGEWQGWWPIRSGIVAPAGSPVTAVSRAPNKLDVFVVGEDGGVYTAAWDRNQAEGKWRGWWRIKEIEARPGTLVSAVARDPSKLDIFVVGKDGGVYTAAWDHNVANGEWRGWWQIKSGVIATPGSPVTVVSRDPNKLDVFVVGTDGRILTAAWDHFEAEGKWRGWWRIRVAEAPPGTLVSAVARDPNKLDVFVVDNDGRILTAAWDHFEAEGKWRGWWQIKSGDTIPGSPVTAVSRDPNKLDVFIVGKDGGIYTAAWDHFQAEGKWRGWWRIKEAEALPDSPVSAVSRDPNKLDVFVVGKDGQVLTAAWDHNVADGKWRGWWPIAP